MVKNHVLQIRKAVWQAPALIVFAAVTAILTNAWRSDGISLVGDWSVKARLSDISGDSLVIPLELAAEQFATGSTLFLDARPESQYLDGHIQSAINLPWQKVDQYFVEMAGRIDGSEMIITYCDGESCELSHELALFLKEMGYENVRVLVNGWTVWQHAGLPAEIGSNE
jgi:rhodanese-related sulfurtransferase